MRLIFRMENSTGQNFESVKDKISSPIVLKWHPPAGYKPDPTANERERARRQKAEDELDHYLFLREERRQKAAKRAARKYINPLHTKIEWITPFCYKEDRGMWQTSYMALDEENHLLMKMKSDDFKVKQMSIYLSSNNDKKLWVTGKVVNHIKRCNEPESKYLAIIKTFSIGKKLEEKNLFVLYDEVKFNRDALMEEDTLFGGYLLPEPIKESKVMPAFNLYNYTEWNAISYTHLQPHHVRKRDSYGRMRWSIENSQKEQWANFGPKWIDNQLRKLKE